MLDAGSAHPRSDVAGRAAFVYGIACYCAFASCFAVTVLFVSDFGLTQTIDRPVTAAPRTALAIDIGLLLGFGVQHSVMARAGFKRRWTRVVPAAIERSTYVLATVVALSALFWQWRPIEAVVWDLDSPVTRTLVHTVLVCGWLLVLIATALINHADLSGLRQVWCRVRGRRYFTPGFVTPGPYRIVRHPLYLGWIIAFWATPHMTAGHLLFATAMTLYILVAIRFEERDLLRDHGDAYRNYRDRVPGLLPRIGTRISRMHSGRGMR